MSGVIDSSGGIDARLQRLQRLLGGDELATLRKRLRRRFERAPVDAPIEHIRINRLTGKEHAALASLLGRPQRYANSLQIDVRLVDAALQRAAIASSLCGALEQLDGPIANLAGHVFSIMAILTGRDCALATTSCASSVQNRGVSMSPITSPPSMPSRTHRILSKARQPRQRGTWPWRRRCNTTGWLLLKKRSLLH